MTNSGDINQKEKMERCPLCNALIPYEKWLKVIGAWEQKRKALAESRTQLAKLKEQQAALRVEKKALRAKMKEATVRARELVARKIEVEKKRAEARNMKQQRQFAREKKKLEIQSRKFAKEEERKKLGQQLQKKDSQIKNLQQHIERLKKGITPQIDGFEFERKVLAQLRQMYPEDEFAHRGKEGDILHIVKEASQEVGKILYELKKTEKFETKFIDQIRQDRNDEKANYGVLVSWENPKNKQGFFVDREIIVVHPFGLLDMATFLRAALVEIHKLKLTQRQADEKGREILRYMQSEDFKTLVSESITHSMQAAELLKKEVRSHISVWHERYRLYGTIFRNIGQVQHVIHSILTNGKAPDACPELAFIPLQLPVIKE